MHSGILLIDKPEGPSSARVVAQVKQTLRAKKVGHLGTLDPFASGLLPLGINEGTKIAEIFLSGPKSYRGVVALGIETDTQDATGQVLRNREVPSMGQAEIRKLQEAFTGDVIQIPPMYSALKKDGVRLYRLARQGKEIPRAPRSVKIASLRLWLLDSTELGFEVTCSRGTYVRTLAADMGEFLGCGGHLKSLKRLACGHLKLEQAVSLSELEQLAAADKVPLLSINQALAHLRSIRIEGHQLSRLRSGQQEFLLHLSAPKEGESMLRLVDRQDRLVALARWVEEFPASQWRLFRVFSA